MPSILIIHDERDHLGGAETLLRELTAALRQQGCTVAWCHDHVPQAVREFRPDFVLAMTLIVKVGLGALQWLQWEQVPHALVLVDYWAGCPQRNMAHLSQGRICTECTADCPHGTVHPQIKDIVNRSPVLALNPYQMAINHRLGVRTDAWAPCGLDVEFWHPAEDWQVGKPRVLSSTAWSQAAYGNIWWKGEQFLRTVEQQIGQPVHGITGVPRWAVRDALQAGSIYVFPSVWNESWGYCLTEAMACGLACVAFDQAGARTQIENGVDGILLPAGDVNGMAQAVAGLLAAPSERQRLGRAAALKVRERYSLDVMGRTWLGLIEQIAAGRVAA